MSEGPRRPPRPAGSSRGPATEPFQLAAVLFDMDGTLLATEQYWDQALVELAAEWGTTVSAQALAATTGMSLGSAMRLVHADVGVERTPAEQGADARRVERRVADLMAAGISWQPGARDLLTACRSAGVRTALVTTTPRALVEVVLGHLRRDLGAEPFDTTVCGDEVPARKPDPAPYTQAMETLGLGPADCVVVEDSLAGTTAGLAAGCRVLAVPGAQVLSPVPGLTVRPGLDDVGVQDLRDLPQPSRSSTSIGASAQS